MDRLAAFIRFCRPHTIIATSLQVTSLFILARSGVNLRLKALAVLLLGLASGLATSSYIAGLNQLLDVDIDRISEPTLPLANTEFIMHQGRLSARVTGLRSEK